MSNFFYFELGMTIFLSIILGHIVERNSGELLEYLVILPLGLFIYLTIERAKELKVDSKV
ncbi:MAG: hypothetical protein ACREAK_08160 [Nitrosarchaeum sp.]